MTPQYPDQARKAAEMTKKGASILVCGNALKAYNMDNSELWPNVEVVSSGIVEIRSITGRWNGVRQTLSLGQDLILDSKTLFVQFRPTAA